LHAETQVFCSLEPKPGCGENSPTPRRWRRVVGMTTKIAGEPHTPRESGTRIGPNRSHVGRTRAPVRWLWLRPASCISVPLRSSSPLYQPLRASHQNPHHRSHPAHLRRPPPMRRPSRPDALQPLGGACASAGAAMHPALPAGHRWCPARLARSGSGATSRGGLSQRQAYSPGTRRLGFSGNCEVILAPSPPSPAGHCQR
jgi:hypothetical protein